MRSIVVAGALFAITLLLYAFHLGAAPLTPEESAFNTHGQSIRAGWTPLYFRVSNDHWLQPAGVYANAAAHAIGGDEVSGRIISVIAGAINVALVFVIAHALTGRLTIGVFAALILLFTPAHWSMARLGTDAIVPVPLVLAWLWSSIRFFQRDRGLDIAASLLGLSVYAYPAGPLTAGFLWILTVIVARRRNRLRLLTASAVFGLAWLPAVAWFYLHPDTYPDTFGRWFIFAAHLRNPIDGLVAFINPTTLGNRLSLYWGFWNPSWLFFSANSPAPLLMVASPLIVVGVYRCLRHVQRELPALLIGGALVVPLAGASFGEPRYLHAAAAILPLLALLAGLGVEQLVNLVVRPQPLEDDERPAPVEGWHSDDIAPRS